MASQLDAAQAEAQLKMMQPRLDQASREIKAMRDKQSEMDMEYKDECRKHEATKQKLKSARDQLTDSLQYSEKEEVVAEEKSRKLKAAENDSRAYKAEWQEEVDAMNDWTADLHVSAVKPTAKPAAKPVPKPPKRVGSDQEAEPAPEPLLRDSAFRFLIFHPDSRLLKQRGLCQIWFIPSN